MTFNEIILEQQIDRIQRLDTAWARFQIEALAMDRASRRGVIATMRSALAGVFVRFGVWLDRAAGERAFTPSAH
jgi:hypothetical protein